MGKRETLDDVKQAMVEKLLDDLEHEGADWVREWAMPAPYNMTTSKPYRGQNAFLLMYQMAARGIEDPRFMTFNQAKARGLKVRKGSRSFKVEMWREMFYLVADPKSKIRQPADDAERAAMRADAAYGSRWLPVGHFNVFSAADIEGVEPYDAGAMDEAGDDMLDFLESYSPCTVREALQGQAFYSPGRDMVTIPVRRQFGEAAAAARTLLHEIGHATGHPSRLDRPQKNPFGSDEYAFEELVAEMCCMFTASALRRRLPAIGEDAGPYWDNHVAYLRGWLTEKGDAAAAQVMKAAGTAAKASDWLMANCFPAMDDAEQRNAA